jgi:hypothetical protein
MDEPGWIVNAEKLRCLMLLDDGIAELLSDRAGSTYFRAFIVEDRVTGEIRLKFRYQYKDPNESNWFQVTTEKRGTEAVEDFRAKIEKILRTGYSILFNRHLPEPAVKSFFPPDDRGDGASTLIWLEMKDLIEIRVEQDEPRDTAPRLP